MARFISAIRARCHQRLLFRALFYAGLGLCLVVPATVTGRGGVFSSTKHGDPNTGVQRDPGLPRGGCAQCHVLHDPSSPQPFALFAPNTNGLCYTSGCHATSGSRDIYQGPASYEASSHATSTNMVWPGFDSGVDAFAPRPKQSGDWGKCINCHDPHGYNRDGAGLIPSLAFSREEKLCVVCHDGSPALQDIRTQFHKPYRHPVATSGRHTVAEDGNSAAYGISPVDNRHAECVDCHNPHVARSGAVATFPPDAPERIRGVSRIAVTNGAPGIAPSYSYRGPSDTTPPVAEYQICFKCHSSWTTQPPSQRDLSVLFNTNNPSYHPVEAQGKNLSINPNAFVNNWSATNLMYCGDCHSSDDANARGPHGSQFRYILKRDYVASSASRTMSSAELCFDCHRYDVYANDSASNTVKGYSRFNPPAWDRGHTRHVGGDRYPCYACHESHGSTTKPHLIVTGRSPGLTNYTQTATGGTCYPTCHGSETYTINYPR